MGFELPSSGAILVSALFYDEAQNVTRRSFTVPWDTDLATTLANAIALLAEVEPLTDAKVVASVTIQLVQNPEVGAQAGSEVENCAALSCVLDTDATHTTPYHTLDIPAPKIGLFLASSGPNKNVIDTTDADILAFIAQFAATTGVAVVSDNQTIASLAAGKRVHKRSRKG